jgi:hypothetical protein
MERNSPCWCGSGMKYKKCHWLREKQAPIPVSSALDQFERIFGRGRCLAPDAHPLSCGGKFVRAHTLPKRSQLDLIAEAGHVYGPDASFSTLRRTVGRTSVGRIGINRASTFSGFCAVHDNALFDRVDTLGIEPDAEQCHLLTYRSLCRELYLKEAMAEVADQARGLDRGKNLEAQIWTQETAFLMGLGATNSVLNLRRHKAAYDRVLLHKTFDVVRALIVDLDRVPDLMCTSGISVDTDFGGGAIQDLGDLEAALDYLGFSLIASSPTSGVAVFSWHRSSDASNMALVSSFLAVPDAAKPDALLRFALEHSENVFMRPAWWNGLDQEARDAVVTRIRSGLPFSENAKSSLTDDGRRLAPWHVVGIRTLGLPDLLEGDPSRAKH